MRIMLVGLGLIGGSLGLCFQDNTGIEEVWGFDADGRSADEALKIGAVSEIVPLESGLSEADLIILCTPLKVYPELIPHIAALVKPGAIITDVGSTKTKVMEYFTQLPPGVWAIGGHPMAGSEITGIKGADRYLFENAAYILTPAPGTPEEIKQRMSALVQMTGAKVRFMTAQEHDAQVAVMSHLPHLTAAALVNLTQGKEDLLLMAGGGFRDTTRISASNPDLWQDILFSNRDQVLLQIQNFIAEVTRMGQNLYDFNVAAVHADLEQARNIREQVPRLQRGLGAAACDLVCVVPDQPGIIGDLGRVLGEINVNIADLEILRVREGDGGTIRIGVESAFAAEQAVNVLRQNNIKAWVR